MHLETTDGGMWAFAQLATASRCFAKLRIIADLDLEVSQCQIQV